MTMQTYRFTLSPLTAFGTPLAGDTLFGQLCWTLRHQLGNDRLAALLAGYTAGRPFAVVSDAFPAGHVPLPALPSSKFLPVDPDNRKAIKAKRWLAIGDLQLPVDQWQEKAASDREVAAKQEGKDTKTKGGSLLVSAMQPHNTINRATGTTGTDMFAPYASPQIWYVPTCALECYVVLDEERLSLAELTAALKAIGQTGYGRDAGSGLGKFDVAEPTAFSFPHASGSCFLTLAPCAPQGMGWLADRSYYRTQTRFGRHGDMAARGSNPFKRPLLMARTGAVFTLDEARSLPWAGQGIGGVSFMAPEAVHQGYAPVIYLPSPV